MFANRAEAIAMASKFLGLETSPDSLLWITLKGQVQPHSSLGLEKEAALKKLRPRLAGWVHNTLVGAHQIFADGSQLLVCVHTAVADAPELVAFGFFVDSTVAGLQAPYADLLQTADGLSYYTDGVSCHSMGKAGALTGTQWEPEPWADFWFRLQLVGIEGAPFYATARKKSHQLRAFSLATGSFVLIDACKSGAGITGWLRLENVMPDVLCLGYTAQAQAALQIVKTNPNPVADAWQAHVSAGGRKAWQAYVQSLPAHADPEPTLPVEFEAGPSWYEAQVRSAPIYGTDSRIAGYVHTLVMLTDLPVAAQPAQPEVQVAKAAYEEALLLTKEANHRIKNSLSMAASLLQLQSYSLEDEAAKVALSDAVQRLYTVSDLHEALYKYLAGADKVDMKPYLEAIADRLRSLVGAKGIDLRTEIVDAQMPTKKASRVGFLINELVLNAAKYAFENPKQAYIAIYLTNKGNEFYLSVQDNGKGIEPKEGMTESLGTTLITEFAKDLQAQMRLETQAGTRYMFTFTV